MRIVPLILLCLALIYNNCNAVMPIRKADKDSTTGRQEKVATNENLIPDQLIQEEIDERQILLTETSQTVQSNSEVTNSKKFTQNTQKFKKKSSVVKQTDGNMGTGIFGIISFLTGLASFLVPAIGPFLALIAIITGAIGFNKKNKGFAIAGFILGIAWLILVFYALNSFL